MGDNIPRRHHYIPVMLLENFCDANGRVWVGRDDRVFPTTPQNVFVEKDFYATFDLSDVPSGQDYEEVLDSRKRGYEYEEILSGIEDAAAPAVRQIIKQARQGNFPRLTPALRAAWKQFVIALIRRTPESQEREISSKKISDLLYEKARDLAAEDSVPMPDIELLYGDSTMAEIRDKAIQNTYATHSAGDTPELQKEAEEFSRKLGLLVAVSCIPGIEFVIGSYGFTVVEPGFARDPFEGSWLPIAHDVAVHLTKNPGKEDLVLLRYGNGGDEVITKINRACAAQSRMIAGRAEALVRSLMQG